MPLNPWAHAREESEFAEPTYPDAIMSRYAVPDHLAADAPYNDTIGWAPVPRIVVSSTPDAMRLGRVPARDMRPEGNRPAEEWYRPQDVDKKARHSAEDQDADGWTETKVYPTYPNPAAGFNRFALNPRGMPPPEPRLTQQMAPRTYTFTRPFMWGLPKEGARQFNGNHFSMASHRREYDILGMAPQRRSRNTYRLTPQPWDADIVDVPPDTSDDSPNARIQAMDVPYASRSWRL